MASYFMLYPEKRHITEEQILSWARDMEADGDIDGGFGNDVEEAIRQLEDAGVLTIKK